MKRIALTALAGLAAPMAMAEEQRGMGAHEHGVSQLELAIEDGTLTLALRAPGADIVGFEHAARSDEDKAAVDAALSLLRQPEAVFALPEAAGCTLVEADAGLEGEGDHGHEDEHGHDDHDHDEHGHDDHDHDEHGHDDHDHDEHGHDEHDHEAHGHDDHDHEHGAHEEHAHEEGHGGHSEFHAMYVFTCADTAALTEIALPFFQSFPNAQEVTAQYVTDSGVGAAEVKSATAAVLALD